MVQPGTTTGDYGLLLRIDRIGIMQIAFGGNKPDLKHLESGCHVCGACCSKPLFFLKPLTQSRGVK